MLRNYRTYYRAAVYLMFLIVLAHSFGHYLFYIDQSRFAPDRLAVAQAMQGYRADEILGGSLWRILQMFSLSFSLLFLLGGCLNLAILQSALPAAFLGKMIRFNLRFWLVAFCTFAVLHPVIQPLVCSGTLSLLFGLAWWRFDPQQQP